MAFSINNFNQNKQSGVALLILVIVIAISAITYIFSGISIDSVEQNRDIHTQQVLQQAKRALIAYAITHADRGGVDAGEFGYLPCPYQTTTPDEGNQEITCDNSLDNSFGYLPWRSLDIPLLYDGDGACLLYAVSSRYKLNPLSGGKILNEDSFGTFQIVDQTGAVVQGVNPEDRPVAIIFAPGKALPGQTRGFTANTDCGQDFDMTQFLEGNGVTDNGTLLAAANSIDQFIHATPASADEATPYNDRFITITRDEIWPDIIPRADFQEKMQDLTEALAICLANYANTNATIINDFPAATPTENTDETNDLGRRLPFPAKFDLNVASYTADNSYTDDDDMDGAINIGDGFAGRYPYIVNQSDNVLGIVGAANLFDSGFCGATGALTNGNDVDLSDANGEFRKLWSNWKDHFFYILSDAYKPEPGGLIKSCDGNTCVSVDGTTLADKRAGIVIFSNTHNNDVIDDIADAAEYIEATNVINFPTYNIPTPGDTITTEFGGNQYQSNNGDDIMFCITNKDTHTSTFIGNPYFPVGPFIIEVYNQIDLSVDSCP